MLTLRFGKKQYGPLAECYNDLTARQLKDIVAIILKSEEEMVSALKALRILLGMSLLKFFMLPQDVKAAMLEHTKWVFERNGLTRQLVTYYRGLYGPADHFDNLTMGEWNACEIFYRQIIDGKEDVALDKLVTVLFRKAKPDYDLRLNSEGDIRRPFNMHELEYYSRQVSHWPTAVKVSVLMWFDGCREELKQGYDLFEGQGSDEQSDPGMFEVIRALCGKKYGGMKEVEGMNVHLALREMEAMKKEADEIEKQTKK